MTVTVGQLTLPDSHAAALTPFAEKAKTVLGTRIDPVTVRVLPRSQMRRYRNPRPGDGPTDGRARGFWHSRSHIIDLADDLFAPGEPMEATLGHELIHTWFSDAAKPALTRPMLPLLTPQPENYSDQIVNGRDLGYPGTPEEALAVWGSAALFGFNPPAYVTLFKRKVLPQNLPTLKGLLLAAPTTEPTVPEPTPTPPPNPDKERIAFLEASLAEVVDFGVKKAKEAGIGGGG